MFKKKGFLMTLFLLPFLFAADVTVTDGTINAGETYTMTANNTYFLDGFVYVEEGAVLAIQPGTVIKARQTPTTGDNASALIVARGGRIEAMGTAENPIIFTSEFDDLNNPSDLLHEDRGLWGGVILLGYATTNRGIEGQIEGIPSGETRAIYGGDNDYDSSGAMHYVSIRHGGAELGPGDEINGLTMGAVGSGTVISHVEVYSNLDDGFEWFGGTVNTRYLIAAHCGDDGFDYDEGWRGMNQFWFAVQSTDKGGRVGEHDGGTVQETAPPFATPTIVNATYIGPGVGTTPEGDGSECIYFRDNAGGYYMNSIFTEYNGANDGKGITVEDIDGADSRERMENGELVIAHNIWWQFGNGNNLTDFAPQDFVAQHLAANGNLIVDPMINGVSRTADGGLDPRPAVKGPAANGAVPVMNSWFAPVNYYGAFSPEQKNWAAGWTALAQEGYLTGSTMTLTDASIQAGDTLKLSADTTYYLDGFVYVEEGATLIIEPGTVIKAKQAPTTGDNASALIVARGGKLMADGTAQAPIIFTSELDDLQDPYDLTGEDRGLWGGVILLGYATTNRGIEGQIEGIPSGESRALYGGDDDHDSSGVLRYVSIRHGGAELGPGDEINGLTMGAVGDQTIIENVEVYSNLDDGFEWFGGTVNTRNLVAAFCGDDGFDYDEGWRGNNQFWFAIQGTDKAGRVGEHDGGTVQETAPPFATPAIANATYIGPGVNALPEGDGSEVIYFRDNAGGFYTNSIFTDYNGANDGKGITVEDIDGADSRERMESGELVISNNIWWQFGNGNTLTDIAPQDFVAAHLAAHGNMIVDPSLRSVSRVANGMLDPRPTAFSPAASGATAIDHGFFHAVPYHGAFDPAAQPWISGWTALAQEGYLMGQTAGLYINHVTRLNAGFSTEVRFVNQGQQTATMMLMPSLSDGTSIAPVTVMIPSGEIMTYASTDLFGANEVAHFAIHGPKTCSVTAAYKSTSAQSISAEVHASEVMGHEYGIFQGEWTYAWDGVAVINRGTETATLTITQETMAGKVLSKARIDQTVGPNARGLIVFGDHFQEMPGESVILKIHSDQPVSATFLRGTQPGIQPALLFVTSPLFVL
jgi:hypothetical protein